MTLPTWATPFTDDLSTVTAAFLNGYVRTQIPKALDGTGGGAYSPATAIEIGGAGLKVANSTVIAYNSRDVTRFLALIADSSSANWSRANTPRGAWQNTASGGTLDLRLEGLPHGNVLKTLVVRWIGASGHGALPTMPALTLRKIDQDGNETTVATATDTAANVAAYEVAHSITMSSIAHTIDLETYRYVLTLAGETGGNFVANGKILSLPATVTVTSQTEW